MKRLFAAGLALLLMGQAAPPASVADLAWMSGRWESVSANGRWTEESWSAPRGGVMLGYSRSGAGQSLREFEFLRLQAGSDGIPAYLAQPGGRPATAFRLTAREGQSATFDNPQHDFPQRIRYVRTGDRMVATISRLDGSNAVSWTFRRRD
ncbi:MAG TPA: DUF6265 family protein [Allosphingosinicella sp.]|nr:DUF6265 family protein [Allosphingosinicella sp.]